MAGLVDLAIAFTLVIGFMVYYGITPTLTIVILPAFVLLAIATTLSLGILFSALNIEYRDIRYTLPFLVQLWLLATPVAYPSSLIEEPWRTLYGLNPMAGVVDGFRWTLLGADPPHALIGVSILTTLTLLVSGLVYFRRMERTFADVA
jgi:lipopolysaccharide transport system permease protein